MNDFVENNRPDQEVINWETPNEVQHYIEQLENKLQELQEELYETSEMLERMQSEL